MSAGSAIVWIAAVLAATQPQSPPPPVPAAMIVGRVVDGTSGRPIAGAIVTIEGGMVVPGSTRTAARAITNASGQFVFRKLLKGNFVLTATRNGYVDGGYGRRRPGGTVATLHLEERERVSDVVIRMWRHASISGTVTDEAGEPVIGVSLRAFQRRILAGRSRVVQNGSASTDDRGAYRFTHLAPGDYMVAFVAREVSMPLSTAEMMRFPAPPNDPKASEMMRERIALGSPVTPPGTPNAVQVGNMVRQVDFSAPFPPIGDDKALFIYPTQFFPGVPGAARATNITLESGQQRDNVDFTLRPIRAARVSGSVVGADGPVSNIALRLVPVGDDAMTDLEVSATMASPAGEFTFLGVPPGQYTIKALRIPRPLPRPAASTSVTQIQVGSSLMIGTSTGASGPLPMPDEPSWHADVPVAVADADLKDVVVVLQRGARITGRVEFDGTRERPEPANLRRIPILTERADRSAVSPTGVAVPPGQVDESGAFKTYGLPPGKYVMRVGSAPAGWYLRSVVSEGRDISDLPFDLRAADIPNVVITFTDRPTTLSGSARNADGAADPDALVVVFPLDVSGWMDYGLNPRRVRSVRPSKDGSYSITGLPPGDYYVAAIKEDAFTQWQDPQVLEELSRSAAHVRLTEGDTRSQDLKTVGGKQ